MAAKSATISMENRRTESEDERTSSIGLRVEDWKLRINRTGFVRALAPGNGSGIDLSPQVDRKKLGGALVDVEVHLRNAGVRERFRARVGDDADDGGPARLGGPRPDDDALADRILVGPVRCGQRPG